MSELLIAREEGGRYLLSVPLLGGRLLFSVEEDWPRLGRIRCEVLDAWPEGAEVVDRATVIDASRRGPSLDVLLDRGVRHRCRFVVGPAEVDEKGSGIPGADDIVWWQTGAAGRGIPPRQRVPTARERGIGELEIVVDSREQQGYDFLGIQDCDVIVIPGKLDTGDYAVLEGGVPIASVERKKESDFRSSLTTGRLSEQMAVLATLPRAAVVVESSYARLLNSKRVAKGRMADVIAGVQASFPQVPIVFAGNKPNAQEWTWRWLAAAWSHHIDEHECDLLAPRSDT